VTSAEIIAAARVILKETATTIWDDTALGAYLTDAIREITNKEPLKKYVNLAVIEYTKRIDISSLTDLIRIIPQNEVEFPVGNPGYNSIMRDTERVGNELEMLLNSIPTITDGTLTGTVTFTKDSRSVTGSGTLFTTELTDGIDGDFLCLSSGTKYYQIAYITSATALTLAEPFAETTATDTVNVTKYRAHDSVARVCYGAKYTVSTTSDMPQKMDETAILGVAAKAVKSYTAEIIRTNLTDVAAKIVLAAAEITTAGKATAQLALAVSDILAARTSFNTTNATVIGTDLTAIGTALDNCKADLDAGIVLIDTANVGGDVAGKYIEAGKTDVEEAKARTDKVRAYIDVTKPNLEMAAQEIQAAAGYMNNVTSYLKMVESELNVDKLIAANDRVAKDLWDKYQTSLNKLGRPTDSAKHNCSRDV